MMVVPVGQYTVGEQYEERGTLCHDIIYNKNNPKYIIKVIQHIRLCVQRQGRK